MGQLGCAGLHETRGFLWASEKQAIEACDRRSESFQHRFAGGVQR